MGLWGLLALRLVLGGPEPSVEPGPHRYAVIIGANHGNVEEPTLRYATSDASEVARVLTDMGDFARDDVVLLNNPTARDVRTAFADLRTQINRQRTPQGSFLVVYYSGHADALALHLGGTTLSWNDVLSLTNGSAADLRLLVVDACRAGQLTQSKGAHLDNPFALPHNNEELPRGIAIVTSASAGESAQESAQLHASFFTHHFVAGLRGAADMNADGKVTLNEVFSYSSEQAAGDTAQTMIGIQHATYHFHLTGRVELGLTTPAQTGNMGALRISSVGTYVFRNSGPTGNVVLQTHIASGAKRAIWLPSGKYFVQRRTASAVYAGMVDVNGADKPLNVAQLEKTDYAVVSLKGGPEIDATVEPTPPRFELTLAGASGSAILPHFETPVGGTLGLALPMGWGNSEVWALDFQANVIHASAANSITTISEWDTSLAAGVRATFLRAGPLRLSAGPRVGVLMITQDFSKLAYTGRSVAPLAEGVLRLDIQLPSIWFISLQGAARATWLPSIYNTSGSSTRNGLQWQPLAAVGVGATW